MKNLIAIICVLTVLGSTVRAQSVNIHTTVDPLINQICPEFSFDTLLNYKREKMTLTELRGKFVIIDFWGTFCAPCIKAFPKLENLQKRFGDSLQILLLATDGYQKMKHFYETRRKANNPMLLPCTINRNMVKYFKVQGLGTYVWIDDKGYIRAITEESQVTEQNIARFINRKTDAIHIKERSVDIDYEKPLTVVAKEMDSSCVIFGSTLTGHIKGLLPLSGWHRKGTISNKFIAINLGLKNLYQFAYGDSSGSVPSARNIIETAHPEKFTRPDGADVEKWRKDNTYCYEFIAGVANEDSVRKLMRYDLQRLFKYNAYLENRVQKCLVLKAEKGFRFLEDTTVKPKLSYNIGGIIVTNHSFQQFFGMIKHFIREYVIYDETGLTGKVDITIQAMMNDVNALNKELKRYGLSLQYEDRPMQVLVIKDPG